MNPYFVLQVPNDANDATVRKAYLEAVQIATPESDPTRFKEISEAYENIKTQEKRYRYEWSRQVIYDATPVEILRQCLSFHPPTRPLEHQFMQGYLRDCLKQLPS